MPAASRSVRFAQYRVGVQLRLSPAERDIADHGEHFDLLVNRNFLVVSSLALKKTEYGVFQGANGGEVTCGEAVLFGELREFLHDLIAFFQYQCKGFLFPFMNQLAFHSRLHPKP